MSWGACLTVKEKKPKRGKKTKNRPCPRSRPTEEVKSQRQKTEKGLGGNINLLSRTKDSEMRGLVIPLAESDKEKKEKNNKGRKDRRSYSSRAVFRPAETER